MGKLPRNEEVKYNQVVVAHAHRYSNIRVEANKEKIQTALKILAEHGKRLNTNGRVFIQMDQAAIHSISRDEMGCLMTTEATLKATTSSSLRGDCPPSFVCQIERKAMRSAIKGCTCEVGEFIELCEAFGVEVLEAVRQWAQSDTAKSLEPVTGAWTKGIKKRKTTKRKTGKSI